MSNINKEQKNVFGDQPPGYWLGMAAKIILGVAMLVYLGLHSYNFFSFTFKCDQWIFAVLGLFTTSIGFLLWLVIYLYVAEDGLAKAVSIVMMFVSLFGEFVVAGFDMYMNISGQLSQTKWTPEELRYMSYAIAGLALLNGLALVADIAGRRIASDLSNVKWLGRKEQAAPPVVTFASDTEVVRQSDLDHLVERAKAAREKAEAINSQLKDLLGETEGQGSNGVNPTNRQGQK